MQQQQTARIVAQHVQHLQRSTDRRNTTGQLRALKDLLHVVADADAAAKLLILQQPGVLAVLRQLCDMYTSAAATSSTAVFGHAAMLLSMLARPGPQAAELITAQPGMLPALAGLLARSSAAKARCAFTACYAAVCFVSLCDFEVSARRVAAEPAAVSGLVGLLSVADVAPVADGGQTRVAMQAAIALVQLSGSHAQRVLQQPGIMAALACLLQHQHSTEAQCTGLDVLSALVTGLAAAAEAGASAAVRPVMQQLARQPGVMQDLVRLLTSRQESAIAKVRATTVNVLHYLVFYDHATASQLVEQPAALAALAKALGSVNKDERRMAAKAFFVLSQGVLS